MANDNNAAFARLPRELEVTEEKMAAKWKLWKQGFHYYATATQLANKPAEVQAAIFMSAIGPVATVIFNTFVLSDEGKDNLAVIKERFDNYFSPKPNETYTRYIFFNCVQGGHEIFDSYLTKLKTKILDCSFGLLQDSLLRDQIVRGIESDKVRELLWSERELTLNKAVDICRASEQASNQLKDMHISENTEKEVFALKQLKRSTVKASKMVKSLVEF